MTQVLFSVLAGLLLVTALMWVIVPIVYGLPPIAASRERIRRALQLADPRPGETLYDLGSGHGRVLVMAAREFNLKAVGVEIGPVQRMISRGNARLNGVSAHVQLLAGNLYHADLSRADIVFAYLTSRYALPLRDKFARELKKGTRIVTVAFDLPGWSPKAFDREFLIYLYEK